VSGASDSEAGRLRRRSESDRGEEIPLPAPDGSRIRGIED